AAAREIVAGTVCIKDVPTFPSHLMPYGGGKQRGPRRGGGRFAVEEVKEVKDVSFRCLGSVTAVGKEEGEPWAGNNSKRKKRKESSGRCLASKASRGARGRGCRCPPGPDRCLQAASET